MKFDEVDRGITPLNLERGSTRCELSTSYNGVRWNLNWLVFDKNYALLTGGYQRISSTPREYGQDVAHELLSSPSITITQPGFVYIYLSNEEATPVEVYFAVPAEASAPMHHRITKWQLLYL